jgi:NOL1/NOP2/fmu family ribosome biogenesis protein
MSKQYILNSKKTKEIYNILNNQWEIDNKIDYVFLMNDDNNIYIINRDIDKIDLNLLRINSIGLYLGEIKDGKIRLSIEGSQIFGPMCKKNIIELNSEEMKTWMIGEDIIKEYPTGNEYVIIKYKNDYLGSGKCRDNKIFNFVPKTRRLKNIAGNHSDE